MSGCPERMLTALRTFSSFCDFTDSLWRSSLRSSVSIDGDKTCIAGLSCGCLLEERVKITQYFRNTGRWELRVNVELYPFFTVLLMSYLVFYIYSVLPAVRLLSLSYTLSGTTPVETNQQSAFCLSLSSFCSVI